MKQEKMKPAMRRRYEFIEFQLMWEGIVGRKQLQDKFEISPQQATVDLTSYLDMAPKNMGYDNRQRTYVAQSGFKPLFLKGEASEYLLHLEMLHHGYRSAEEIWPMSIPSFDAVAVASRRANPQVLKKVLRAIRQRSCISVMYVSLSSESEAPRSLFPHAIASDGHRWHMRAYDLEKDRYSDFVLSRIETIDFGGLEKRELPSDKTWENYVQLRLKPDQELSTRQKAQIEIEYDMTDGELSLQVRQAMLFYYLRFYGFDPVEMDGDCMRNKSSFHLKIANLKEIERCLERRN